MAIALSAFSAGMIFFFLPWGLKLILLVGGAGAALYWWISQRASQLILTMILASLGFCYVSFFSYGAHHPELNAKLHQKIIIVGQISSIPINKPHHLQLDVQTLKVGGHPEHEKIRLNWYGYRPYLLAGDVWRLCVKLHHPRLFRTKSGFNYPQYLRVHGIAAVGYVVPDRRNRRQASARVHPTVNTLRQRVALQIKDAVKDHSLAGLLIALTVGSRHLLTQKEWHVLQATGTSHLVAVSGLHVGLVASLVYSIVNWLWRRIAWLCVWIPSQQIARLVALCAAIFYSILSGLAIPTVRAIVMLTLLLSASILHRNIPVWFRLLGAFTVVMLLNPFVISSVSFWLSFTATGILVICLCGRLQAQTGLLIWFKTQALIFLGLLPITLLYFKQLSVVSLVTNLVAIPGMSVVVLPLCLLALACYFFCSQGVGAWMWVITAKALWPLWWVLCHTAALPFALWIHTLQNTWCFCAVLVAAGLCLLPIRFPGRSLALILGLSLFFSRGH